MEYINTMTYHKPLNAAIIVVTPEMAGEYLTHNHNNRKLDAGLVEKYATDMLNGKFTLNPDAIAFDTDGNLVNGQHRLKGIVKSGVPTACVVIYDFPVTHADFLNFDCGKNRSIKARIELAGYDVKRTAVDIAGAYLDIKYKTRNSLSTRLEFIETNSEILEWAVSICGSTGASGTRIPALFMVAMIDAKLCGVPDEAIEAFSRVYRNNDFDNIENYNPKHVVELRESRLSRNRQASTINVVKSRFNAFVNKLSKCYIRDNLYPAPLLPIHSDDRD